MLITESSERCILWVVNDLKTIEVTTSQVASKLQRTNIKRMIFSPSSLVILKLRDKIVQI